MKILFSGVLFWLLIVFPHSASANECDEIIITIDGSPQLLIALTDLGIIMGRTKQRNHNNEQQASGSSTATINNEPVSNPETELTINGLGGFTINSLLSFIEAIGDRTVYITGDGRLTQYRVVDSHDRTGRYQNVWTELNRVHISHWYQLFSDSEYFLRGSDALVESPEQFFHNAHTVASSDNSCDFPVNPLCLFFNREWLQQLTQFLQVGNTSGEYYHLDLRVLYFRTDWTVYLTEPGITYRIMQLGRVLFLNIVNVGTRALQAANPDDDNTLPPASCVLRETTL